MLGLADFRRPLLISLWSRVRASGRELVALKSTILYHAPHDLLKKAIIFQGYLCDLDSEQSGNCPKVELGSLSDKI